MANGFKWTESLGASIVATWAELGSGAKWSIALAGVSLVISGVQALIRIHEEAIQTAQQNADAYAETTKGLSSYREETESLITSIESGTLSSEELYEARSRLLEIEDDLVVTYGAERDSLNLLTADVESAAEAYDALAKMQASKFYNANKGQIDKAIGQMYQDRQYGLGSFRTDLMSASIKAQLQELDRMYDNIRLVETTIPDIGNVLAVEVTGNVEEANEALNCFVSDLNKIPGLDNLFLNTAGIADDYGSVAQDILKSQSKIIDTYSLQATEGVNALITSSDTYTGILNNMEQAESDYTEAASNSYESAIKRAEAMAEIKKGVDSALTSLDTASIDNEGVAARLESEASSLRDIQKELALGIDLGSALDGKQVEKNADVIINSLRAFEDEAGKIDVSEILNAGVGNENWDTSRRGYDALEDEQRAYLNLKNAVAEYGLTVDEAIPIFKQYGLISKSNAESLGDATKAYTTALTEQEAVTAAINEQSFGTPASLETYEALIALSDEYSDALIVQNGALQLNAEKLQDIAAKRDEQRLAVIDAAIAEAEADKALNLDRIEEYSNKLLDNAEATEAMIAERENEIDLLNSENSELDKNITKLKLMAAAIREANSARSAWLNSQDDPVGNEALLDASDALSHLNEVLNKPNSAIYGFTENSRYKSALEFAVPDDVLEDAEDGGENVIRAYLKGINNLFKKDGSGNIVGINAQAVWQKTKELFEPDGTVKKGTTIQDFAESLGTSVELAEAIISVMNTMGANITLDDGIDTIDELTESTNEAKNAAEEAAEQYEELNGVKPPVLKVNTDGKNVEELEDELDNVKEYIEDIRGMNLDEDTESGLLGYAEEEIRRILALIQEQNGLRIDASNVEEGYEEIADGINRYQSALVDLDAANILGNQDSIDAAKEKLKEIAREIAEMEKADELGLNFNFEKDEDFTVFENTLRDWVNNGIEIPMMSAESTVQEDLDQIKETLLVIGNITTTIRINTAQIIAAISAINSLISRLDELAKLVTTINVSIPSSGDGNSGEQPLDGQTSGSTVVGAMVNYALGEQAPPVDMEAKVNYKLGSQEPPKDMDANVNYGSGGAVNGTAHVSGTAKASGDWGTATAGKTLVGELGPEIVVNPHTGRWYTVGDNGAEFVDMPGGAIVFNHIQSRSLLNNGYVTSRGKALVGGTAMASTSNVGGDIGSFLDKILEGFLSGGSSDSSSSSGSSEPFEDRVKRHQHQLNMEQDTFEEYLEWLDREYQKAYERDQITKEEAWKYEEEVYEGRKELFKDYLNDIEHYIETLSRSEGNENTIITIYESAIKDIEKKIEEAKAYGLDENSDYVQELTKQLYDYQDEITDIQDEATDDAKSAIKELVNYRIGMLKKEIENEKDSLDEKLSDLKDFYDKQKEMLQDVRDEEEYLDEQSEKRKTKAELEAELARLELDNSAWAQKRKLELQEELAEADKDLSDFEKDHALESAQEMLDKLYEKQEEQIQTEIDALDERLNDPEALYNRALADIQNNTLALYEEMVEYNNKYGSGNPEDTEEMWKEAKESLDKYMSTYGEAYKGIILVDSSSGYASGTSNATPGVHAVDELGAEYLFTSSDGTRYRMFSGGEKVLSAKATNFLYKFATSGGSLLSGVYDNISKSVSELSNSISGNRVAQIATGDIIVQGNVDQSTVSELRRLKRDEMQWILKEFNKMNRRS